MSFEIQRNKDENNRYNNNGLIQLNSNLSFVRYLALSFLIHTSDKTRIVDVR